MLVIETKSMLDKVNDTSKQSQCLTRKGKAVQGLPLQGKGDKSKEIVGLSRHGKEGKGHDQELDQEQPRPKQRRRP